MGSHGKLCMPKLGLHPSNRKKMPMATGQEGSRPMQQRSIAQDSPTGTSGDWRGLSTKVRGIYVGALGREKR
ncbi:hypothetical protein ElyMa_002215600 [Elysia marginata]|uniref:Uncharacterized protein n=1 Tax=Elysia marginata TaxID=1093978 RepID=A0AAV4FU91_9GAST|nr:hypothetical protein ElyMa_002215600 [Elysia marginata]